MEHATIRAMLGDVGMELELHTVREEQMLELARFLRAHARMEEAQLYHWAGANLSQRHFASVLRRLRTTWERVTAPLRASGSDRSETPAPPASPSSGG